MAVLPLPTGAALTRITSLVGERILAARAETGCTALQLRALRAVVLEPTMTQLGDRLRLSRSSTTSVVDQLAAAGLATRTIDLADRRRQRVRRTTDGTALLDAFDASIRTRVHELVDDLPARQQRRLLRLLRAFPDPDGLLPLG